MENVIYVQALLPADQLPAHQCTGVTNTGWKCPCCFIVCNSTNAIQKHFESHTGVKAFLCTICNYKGNTIRGMRTHIRVHFDKRNGEVTVSGCNRNLLAFTPPSCFTINLNIFLSFELRKSYLHTSQLSIHCPVMLKSFHSLYPDIHSLFAGGKLHQLYYGRCFQYC